MSDMHPAFSDFARGVTTETAFDVLVIAKQLKAEGKRVVELEIGDSPFPGAANSAPSDHSAPAPCPPRLAKSYGFVDYPGIPG